MHKGVYTEETRNVVCLLVKAGCSRNYINAVLTAVLKSAGITSVGNISRASIARILHEGYYAAQIQLGHEMKSAESMTFSADGTSHCSINYNSCHVHLLAEDYTSPESNTKQHVTCTFGIQWQHVGVPFTFPDTSNNCFQSYCDASAALLLYSDKFKAFLESLRVKKQNSTFNHMETNLWKALHCPSTTTELAVLAIYAEAVSYPYMKAIHTSSDKNQNMLDLGPLHSHVHDHIQKIINNPDILIGKDLDSSESYKTATLDGEEWQNPAVIKKILDLIPTLPHFCDLLLAFFKGAAETWERFTSEFTPGGLIDEATAEERELAWMPATNDENEGALGSFQHLMQYQPQLTLLSHNALAMFFRNNTQAFMAAKFTKEQDYRYIHKLAQEANNEEKKCCQELVEFHDQRQARKTALKNTREWNAKATAERLVQLDIILDEEVAKALKGQNLKDQVKLFRNAGAPNMQQRALLTRVADMRNALLAAITLHAEGIWKPGNDKDSDDESIEDSEEQDEDSEEGEEWEDME